MTSFGFGDVQPWLSRDRVVHGLFHTHPDWTGSIPTVFGDNTPLYFLTVFPIVVFSVFVFKNSKVDNHRETLFFLILAVLGIFLLKMNNPPLEGSYTYLFYRIPFFSAFRESSKFNILIVFSYSILFPLGLLYIMLILKILKNLLLQHRSQ